MTDDSHERPRAQAPSEAEALAVDVYEPADAGERADVILGRRLPGVSRRVARRLALEGRLTLDGRRCPPSTRVPLGSRLELRVQAPAPAPSPAILDVTARFVYAYKPAGMHTHRLRPDDAATLADAVGLVHPECLHAGPDPRQGGAVHRLDRETTGVVAFARTLDAWRLARTGFRARDVLKLYRARVQPSDEAWPPHHLGVTAAPSPPPTGPWPTPTQPGLEIDSPLGAAGRHRVVVRAGGRPSVTLAWPLPTDDPAHAELLLRLVTGHRHQARVHLAWIGRPIIGDAAYGGPPAAKLRLHATALDLSAACPGEPFVVASLPDDWTVDAPPEPDDPPEPDIEDRPDVGRDHVRGD